MRPGQEIKLNHEVYDTGESIRKGINHDDVIYEVTRGGARRKRLSSKNSSIVHSDGPPKRKHAYIK